MENKELRVTLNRPKMTIINKSLANLNDAEFLLMTVSQLVVRCYPPYPSKLDREVPGQLIRSDCETDNDAVAMTVDLLLDIYERAAGIRPMSTSELIEQTKSRSAR